MPACVQTQHTCRALRRQARSSQIASGRCGCSQLCTNAHSMHATLATRQGTYMGSPAPFKGVHGTQESSRVECWQPKKAPERGPQRGSHGVARALLGGPNVLGLGRGVAARHAVVEVGACKGGNRFIWRACLSVKACIKMKGAAPGHTSQQAARAEQAPPVLAHNPNKQHRSTGARSPTIQMWSRSPVDVHIAMAACMGGGRNHRSQLNIAPTHRTREAGSAWRHPARGRPTSDAAWIGKPAAAVQPAQCVCSSPFVGRQQLLKGMPSGLAFADNRSSRDPRTGLE